MWIVEDLESAIDIVDLVSKYTSLKKSGVNYKSVCPFPGHSEKTPSFMVSKSKQLGYCFGCHKGWGAIKFVMDIENCEFREAIEILGNFTGIKVNSNFNKENFETQRSLYSLYKEAVNYYKQALKNYPEIKKYLMDRGLQSETIEKFHFWYADSGIGLYNYLKEKWYDDKLMEESKIFVDLRWRKDKFINRIIFPIQSLRWDFVALAGRIVWEWEPKYLNSPASKIYDKSNILYWLYNARATVTKEDFIIITEGYMDTIALQEAGFFNTVAVSGTALTEKHLSIVKRLTSKVYLCFDSDKAWEKATKASLELMKNKGFEVKIILLPKWKDPDDIVKSGKDFQTFIDHAFTPIWYCIKKSNLNLNSIEDKKKVLAELIDIVKSYSDSVEKDFYLKEISKLLDINSKIVYDTFNRTRFKVNNTDNEDTISNMISNEELAIGYILASVWDKNIQKNIGILKENIIFTDNNADVSTTYQINTHLDDFIKIWNTKAEQGSLLNSLDLNTKEKYRWIGLKIEEENKEKTEESIENEIKKIAIWINKTIYKNKVEILKTKMNAWDTEAFKEYSELVRKAKELGVK
jgi:DNA primase